MDYPLACAHSINTRHLDMIPGGLAWLSLGLVVIGALAAPAGLLAGVALLAGYSAARFLLAGFANVWGLHLIRRWESLDWQAEYGRRLNSASLPLESIHHLVVVPNYQESPDVLRRSLDWLAKQANARTAISVVLAMEVAEPGAREKGERLRVIYGSAFAHVFVTLHPTDIPGEIRCKSANLNWAVRWAKRAMVDELGCNLDSLVVTTMDADTLWHVHYFESLSVLFATDPQRHTTYWQAPIRYHGNVWTAHPLMRILHAYASAWELAYLAAPWWQVLPMSSYSVSLRLLHSTGYYDPDVIADEWHMYVKSWFALRGNQRVQPIFLPFLAGATTGGSWHSAIRARYRQTFRHAWGAKEIGGVIAQMNATSQSALRLLVRVAHDNLLAGAGWIIMFLGSQLPLLFHPEWTRTNLGSLPFLVLQGSLVLVTFLTILFWALDVRIRPPRTCPWAIKDRVCELLSLPLVAVLTVVCVALPVLHAQTRLMLGGRIEFRVSRKE